MKKSAVRLRLTGFIAGLCLVGSPWILPSVDAEESPPSPVNQVFQFAYSDTCSAWANGTTSKGTLYLWVPEQCKKVRGLVIMGTNVPEHRLVGHPAIREACAANDLGLVWSVPTFWNFAKDAKGQDAVQVAFFQKLLDGLARVSGYAEVASVPWLPMGESGHLLMVAGLVDQKPERCIAAVCIKNPHYPKDRTVPMLWTLGTAQEWGQTKNDPRTAWNNPTPGYEGWVKGRAETRWPLGIVIEAGSGHFYCTDRMAAYFGKYISAAARARLSNDGSPVLKPVLLEDGFLAHLPIPGHEDPPVTPYPNPSTGDLLRPWFFNEDTARGAQDFARVNWTADTALPAFVDGPGCEVKSFSFNSVSEIFVVTDGEFAVQGEWLGTIPEGFVGAGGKLARPGTPPVIEWVCGPFAPLGGGKFRIALDRSWKTGAASYLVARKDATADTRLSVQPAMVRIQENKEGRPQKITFDPLPDIPRGTRSLSLSATSDAGLPVDFFVLSGPAVVEKGSLVFTPIPPASRMPVEVTVAAWQWGRASEPKVQMAEIVKQTFRITEK